MITFSFKRNDKVNTIRCGKCIRTRTAVAALILLSCIVTVWTEVSCDVFKINGKTLLFKEISNETQAVVAQYSLVLLVQSKKISVLVLFTVLLSEWGQDAYYAHYILVFHYTYFSRCFSLSAWFRFQCSTVLWVFVKTFVPTVILTGTKEGGLSLILVYNNNRSIPTYIFFYISTGFQFYLAPVNFKWANFVSFDVVNR